MLTQQPPSARRITARIRATRTATTARVWIVSFTGLFLLGAAWSLAMPYDGPPDELQHATRAYAVASGQIYAGHANSQVRTAKSLVPRHAGCFRWNTAITAHCQQTPGTDKKARHTRVWFRSGAAGYDPSYYLFVGPILHLWPDMRGIVLARLATDGLTSALLASAAATAYNRQSRWLIAGIAVSLTPVVVNLMGALNPAGVEIAAALAFWITLLELAERKPVRPTVLSLALCSGTLLALTRGFGVGWLAATALVCALGAGLDRLRALRDTRAVRRATAGIAGACALAITWDTLAGANFDLTGASPPNTPIRQIIIQELWDRLPYYLDGTIRLTSYGDIPVPQTVSMIWFAMLGLIVLGGLCLATLRARTQIATIIGISLFMLLTTDANAVRQGFWFSQGRYALPLLIGAPLLAATQIEHSNTLTAHQTQSLLRLIAVTLLPLHMIALWTSMLRFQHGYPANGQRPLNPFTGHWLPPLGPQLPLALMTTGLALLAWGLFGKHRLDSGMRRITSPPDRPGGGQVPSPHQSRTRPAQVPAGRKTETTRGPGVYPAPGQIGAHHQYA